MQGEKHVEICGVEEERQQRAWKGGLVLSNDGKSSITRGTYRLVGETEGGQSVINKES